MADFHSSMHGSAAALPRRNPLHTWWTILRISIEERLIYRGDFALGTLMRFLPLLTQIFLWAAIYQAVHPRETIAGYSYHEMVAYYLLTQISRAFSSMPNLASQIALQIRNGEIKKYLIQPVDLIGFMFLMRVAHKLVYYVVAFAPFALVFFLCRDFFSGWPDATTMAAYLASLVMAFLIGYFLEATLGLVGFWFLEVSSLLFIYMLFTFFFSGHMFPLDMLEELGGPWATIVRVIPLQYLAYFPAAVFLGKIQGADLAWGLAMQLFWVLFFIGLCRLTYYLGVRRYSGYGG
ncbi:MAG: ABC transporter permease [Planctomycetota bacterium]|nr:MAG: ABC transporter permease [Planctomycetota bacterium]